MMLGAGSPWNFTAWDVCGSIKGDRIHLSPGEVAWRLSPSKCTSRLTGKCQDAGRLLLELRRMTHFRQLPLQEQTWAWGGQTGWNYFPPQEMSLFSEG
jgi:hypothetical protein